MTFLRNLLAPLKALFQLSMDPLRRPEDRGLDTALVPVRNAMVGICVGHSRLINGRRDGGAVSLGNVNEWAYNRELADMIKTDLASRGIKSFIVDSYHGTGYTDSMKWLASYLKAEHATLAIELHFNAAGGTANGHEWPYWHDSPESRTLAVQISNAMERKLPMIRRRGAKPKNSGDRGAEFLRRTHCPAVICEPFFGDNPGDWENATDFKREIAAAIAKGIENFLD